MNFTADSDTDS